MEGRADESGMLRIAFGDAVVQGTPRYTCFGPELNFFAPSLTHVAAYSLIETHHIIVVDVYQ